MQIKNRGESRTIEEYLGQFDLHTHAFSHCAFTPKNLTDSDIANMGEKGRLELFSKNLEELCEEAIRKGIKVLGVSDHPQMIRYGVKFKDMLGVFEEKKKIFSKSLRLIKGMEIDIKIDNDNNLFIDTSEMGDRDISFPEVTNHINYFIGSLHYKYFKKHTLPVNKKTYLDFIRTSVVLLSEFKESVRQHTGLYKPVIMGHPYCIIGETNLKNYENKQDIKDRYQNKSQYLRSRHCIIQPLRENEILSLAKLLFTKRIFIETNGQAIRKGFSDIRKSEPFYFPIAKEYIRHCERRGIPAQMLVNSDAHKAEDIGEYELDAIRKNIGEGLIKRIKVPYTKFLR